jgi:hypothetical protein
MADLDLPVAFWVYAVGLAAHLYAITAWITTGTFELLHMALSASKLIF